MRKRCTVLRLATSSNALRATRKIFTINRGFKPIADVIKKDQNYATSSNR